MALTACDTTMAILTDSEQPTNVSATDGEFGDRIEITWTAPDLSESNEEEDEDTEKQLLRYEIERQTITGDQTGLISNDYNVDATTTKYTDNALQQGVVYEYRVRAVFNDGTYTWSIADTGYAITARDILVGSDLGRYPRDYDTTQAPSNANGKIWFQFPVQTGWRYEIQTVKADSTPAETDVRLLSETKLEPATEESSEAGSIFTAIRGGFHYVELGGGSGTVTVRYLGAE